MQSKHKGKPVKGLLLNMTSVRRPHLGQVPILNCTSILLSL